MGKEEEEGEEKEENVCWSMQHLLLFLCIPVVLGDILSHLPPSSFLFHSPNDMMSTLPLLNLACVGPRGSQI